MPELPEVETVVQDLRPQLSGRRIESLQVTRDRLVLDRLIRYPTARQFVQRLRGRTITSVARRGKYIVMPLQDAAEGEAAAQGDEAASPNGAGSQRLIVHLGMTGHLRLWEPEEAPVKHTHVRLLLDSGLELRYDDQRQFGRLLLGTQPEIIAAHAFPARLGPEPIRGDLTDAEFAALIHARRRPVKSALLDQSFLAGLGNIYADEACFRAGIRPSRWTHRLTVRERRALYPAIQEVLENSIAARGSAVIDYVDWFGLRGTHPEKLLVYRGSGEPCPQCGTPFPRTRPARPRTLSFP